MFYHLLTTYYVGFAVVKCCQTGDLHSVTVDELFTENLEPVKLTDLKPGADLMMELNKRIFPITYIKGLCIQCITVCS